MPIKFLLLGGGFWGFLEGGGGGSANFIFMGAGIFPKREGVDSARGVTAIAVCCRNSSCDAIACNGRRTLAFFLLF